MSWFFLLLAGICEIGWPLGFKLSQTTANKWLWLGISVISMGLSGYFLWVAQKEIPISLAYGIWTGIGAVGTFLIGVTIFKDPVNTMQYISAFLIIAGIIGLKLFSN